MFEKIKIKIQTIEGIKSMSREELHYAWKWLEEGRFNDIYISNECVSELSTWCCLML